MGKLIKCHFYYLMNKLTIAILVISIIGILLFALINVLSLDERMDIASFIEYYYSSLFEISKIIGNIIVVLLFGYSFSSSSDGYRTILISKKTPRPTYFISKIILITMVFTIYYLTIVTVIIITGFTRGIYMDIKMLESFFYLYISLLYYGVLSIVLIMALDNIYIVFIIVPLSLISYSKNLYYLCFIVPVIKSSVSWFSFVLPWWYYVIILFNIFLLSILFFSKKTLQ